MKITFKNQMTVIVDYFSVADGMMTVKTQWIDSGTLRALCEDPVATSEIIFEDSEGVEHVHENYTQFEEIRENKNGDVTVIMSQNGQGTIDKVNKLTSDVKQAQDDIKELQESGGSVENYNAVLAMAKISAELITDDEQALKVQELYAEWNGGAVEYKTGTYLRYAGILYKVLKDHTSQETWAPDTAPSLYAKVLTDPSGKILPWEQPDSTNPYKKGDKVTHNGKTWISTADGNVWEPGAVGAPWEEIEE